LETRSADDFALANLAGLACGGLLLAAFVGLPWLGRDLAANGARLLADAAFGAPRQPGSVGLWPLPLIALAAVGLALRGLAAPESARTTSLGLAALGLAGLASVLISAGGVSVAAGLGQWLALGAAGGMVAQAALARPALSDWLSRWRRRQAVPPRLLPYLFLAPGLALYLLWVAGPALYTLGLSLTDWDGLGAAHWVGWRNYRQLLADPLFREALGNNLRWLGVFVAVPTVLGLGLALLLNARRRAARPAGALAAGFYTPLALSLPVVGLLWAWLYNPRLGLVNGLLAVLGVEAAPGWLGDRQMAIWCIIAAGAWRQASYVMLLYLAGLQTIDPRLVDAAVVDGAGGRQLLSRVLLPLLGPTTGIVLVIAIIDSLRAFDLVAVMTRGGQGTQVLATWMYLEAFGNYRMGYGAAIAVVLFAASALGVGAYLAHVLRHEAEG
jgi:multiple sugar transport system permease protein